MTAQEQQMISGLADRIRNAPAPEIDRDAYDLILHTIGTRPDALYILTQTVLIQEMALNQAKAQIDQLKSQPASQPSASFLPGPQGSGSPGGAWGQDSRLQQPSGYQSSSYASQAPLPPSGGGFSNFLHSAATTAAGVIAGEIAFDSLSSLFGHRGGFFGGGGGGFFGGGGITPGSETIINNNYYDDDRGGNRIDDAGGNSRFAQAADQDQNISPDIDDERDNSGDSFADDSSSDDGGSFDDGGSSDV